MEWIATMSVELSMYTCCTFNPIIDLPFVQ